MTAFFVNTWAILDEANKRDGHYNKRPQYMVEADEAAARAWDEYNQAIDANADAVTRQRARVKAQEADALRREAWDKWQQEKAAALNDTGCDCTPNSVMCCPACKPGSDDEILF